MEELKKQMPETMEVLDAGFAAAQILIKHFRDGVQSSDFLNIIRDYFDNDEFQGKFKKGIEGCYKIPTEVISVFKSLNFSLILDLVRYLFHEAKKLLA